MPELDKKSLTEQDIRTKFITPALTAGGKWDVMNQIREEVYFTKGRVIVRGQSSTRGEPKKADYVLSYKPGIRLAVLEAKDNNHPVGGGMQQGLEYGEILDVPYVFSSNGEQQLRLSRLLRKGCVRHEQFDEEYYTRSCSNVAD